MTDSQFKEPKYNQFRQSWNQTSAEVGHHWRPGYYFPDSEFTSLLRQPLPPGLAKTDELTREQHFKTTNDLYYDHKHPSLLYGERIHKKAPGHWKVNYIKDLHEKLGHGGWRRPLTMGNEESETIAEFKCRPGIKDRYRFEACNTNFLMDDHLNEGPTKVGEGSTQNPKLQGKPYYVQDQAVLAQLDPYLSVTHRDHRPFKTAELKGYPKKDAATFWECEEYPKCKGHGCKHNPLPKHTVPRERLPMRDTLVFPTATKIPRPPKAMIPVPHYGLKTQYNELYQKPNHVRQKENYFCMEDTPYTLPNASTNSVFTVPGMYETEYQTIGSDKPVVV